MIGLEERYCTVYFKDHFMSYNDEKCLKEALMHASHHLYCRYGVVIDYESFSRVGESFFVWKYFIPERLSSKFSVGMRFRGISKYLLEHWKEVYERRRVGTRLLFFIDG